MKQEGEKMRGLFFIALLLMVHVQSSGMGVRPREACDRNCRNTLGLRQAEEAIKDHVKTGMQDPDCPEAGVVTTSLAQQIEGGIMGAEGMIQQMQQILKSEAGKVALDQSKCGVCAQNNVVSPVTISRPKFPGYQSFCENRATEIVRGDFNSESEAARFVKNALQGNGSDGERLYAACPDPCSFYVYNGQTTLANGKTRLNVVVQCGMPKGGIFSKYVFNGALVHEWTCTHQKLN